MQHVTVQRDRSRCHHPGTRVHRSGLRSDEWVERDGMQVTTVLRTLVDLCRTLPLAHAVAVVDSALRQEAVTLEELAGALRELPAGRGRGRVVRVLRWADATSGSVLESLCRVLMLSAGLPPAQAQFVVRDARGARIGRVDFAWPEALLVVEADGFAFHSDRRAYREDRRRGNALVLSGWRLLRFSWEDVVERPEQVVAAVRQALQQA